MFGSWNHELSIEPREMAFATPNQCYLRREISGNVQFRRAKYCKPWKECQKDRWYRLCLCAPLFYLIVTSVWHLLNWILTFAWSGVSSHSAEPLLRKHMTWDLELLTLTSTIRASSLGKLGRCKKSANKRSSNVEALSFLRHTHLGWSICRMCRDACHARTGGSVLFQNRRHRRARSEIRSGGKNMKVREHEMSVPLKISIIVVKCCGVSI